MGCDIHMYAEVRQDGIWHKVGKVFPYEYFQPERPTGEWSCYDRDGNEVTPAHADDQHTADCYEHNPQFTDQPYQGRNYALFSVLADCGRGAFEPIVSNRGVPDDASPEYKATVERWDGDGHSHTWLTLRELQEFDWTNATTTMRGVLSEREYVRSLRTRQVPQSWSGGVGGKNIEVLDPETYEAMLGGDLFEGNGTRDPVKHYYVKAAWPATAIDYTANFRAEALPRIAALGDPDNVRVVFFFDN